MKRIPKGDSMNLEITDQERQFLLEWLEEKQRHMIHEINHTDTMDFEALLKKELAVLEELMRRINHLDPAEATS